MSWLWFLAVVVLVAWSCRAFVDYGRLLSDLAGRSAIDRGRIALNPWRDFLERAGRPAQQRAYARLTWALDEARRTGRPLLGAAGGGRTVTIASPGDVPAWPAEVWAWARELAPRLGADARVYLNTPDTALYYIATFMWYPRPVRVSVEPALVKDDVTLAAAWGRVTDADASRLRTAGFTHVLVGDGSRPKLIDLRSSPGAPAP